MFIAKVGALNFRAKQYEYYSIPPKINKNDYFDKFGRRYEETKHTYSNGDVILLKKHLDGNMTTIYKTTKKGGLLCWQHSGIDDEIPEMFLRMHEKD